MPKNSYRTTLHHYKCLQTVRKSIALSRRRGEMEVRIEIGEDAVGTEMTNGLVEW